MDWKGKIHNNKVGGSHLPNNKEALGFHDMFFHFWPTLKQVYDLRIKSTVEFGPGDWWQ